MKTTEILRRLPWVVLAMWAAVCAASIGTAQSPPPATAPQLGLAAAPGAPAPATAPTRSPAASLPAPRLVPVAPAPAGVVDATLRSALAVDPPETFAPAPRAPRSATLFAAPPRTYLPPAAVGQAPRLLSAGRQQPMKPRPATDSPPLASTSEPPPWAPRRLAVYPLARADSPDASPLALRPPRWRPDAGRATVADDPTAGHAPPTALTTVPSRRRNPAPWLLLEIPDPFAPAEAVKLRSPPPDEDPPVSAPGLPAKPKL